MAIYYKNFQSLDAMAGMLNFSIVLDGTNDPVTINGRGVASVVRNAVGNFTVTLRDTFAVIRGVVACPNLGTTALGAYSVVVAENSAPGPTNTFDLQLYLAGVAADVVSGTGFVIECLVPFSVNSVDQYSQANS